MVAGCALVAYADGNVSAEEKQKMMGYLKSSEQLRVFNSSDVIKIFQKYGEKFEFDKIIGVADGNFDEQEKTVVRRMCSELELNPSDFNV
ncbi:tellurite resistance TerB family protein [Rhodospirillum sp. A1_3_36]|uniref:tellurite resistance TerB family protein n=1 Tax=Rhodospirillum sp. A1_3_36 TaxID=3391666 RepID=UPI0039A5BDC9